ncbi:DNA2/NAM7 family helicase [Endozoicomonas gorgoniicola]|uniref:DNA2/NAM7 family helicase n=1 Tax=Endozoicomonas gorgoniicola TaxID=1234144 RepID=A0ABT3MX27_9GAMM|nr:DNA2/NAM7 family helicase [Endozoicomonas gorgoniicola]MCW7553937.1 DNA2/NAM7 family helicase [Endozoicomonas gorgoniicola]
MKESIKKLLSNGHLDLRSIASELNSTKRSLGEILRNNEEFVWYSDDKTWGLREIALSNSISSDSTSHELKANTDDLEPEDAKLSNRRKNRWRVSDGKKQEQPSPAETSLSPTAYRIQEALRLESEATPKTVRLKIKKRDKIGDVWKLVVTPNDKISTTIDESLEGADAWWPHDQGNGKADVLAVLPEESTIHLRYCNQNPPQVDECIFIYLPRYIDAIIDIWRSNWGEKAISWLKKSTSDNQFIEGSTLSGKYFPTLRTGQQNIFAKVGWQMSYMWGPPGTGKTFTLGALLASYLLQNPDKKVLLLSTTNTAVDLALVSIDKSLDYLQQAPELREWVKTARTRIARLGNNFKASYYENRNHLIPNSDKALLDELRKLEAKEPDKEKIEEYSIWKKGIEELRKRIKAHSLLLLKQCQLAALTTTRACFTFDEISNFEYDLVVFDEASQVSIPHALAIAPLGKHCLFTGDHKQLEPICLAAKNHQLAKDWIGTSMFKFYRDACDWCCILDEQSRMAPQISDLVSNLFYNQKLHVAEDAINSSSWFEERAVNDSSVLSVCRIESKSGWSSRYNGPLRSESAERVVEQVQLMQQTTDLVDILVLTPFRAQRALIKMKLKEVELGKVHVSTVHRSQGSEYHTVIFDPVDGAHNFFIGRESLINVAISRAKARLVVMLSNTDIENELFHRMAFLIGRSENKIEPIQVSPQQLLASPAEWLNQWVDYNGCTGRVEHITDSKLFLCDYSTGKTRAFIL